MRGCVGGSWQTRLEGFEFDDVVGHRGRLAGVVAEVAGMVEKLKARGRLTDKVGVGRRVGLL